MNGKQSKKIRRLASQMAKSKELEVADKAIQEFFNFTLKPRPKWLPGKIWMWLLRRFLNI